MEYTQLPEFRDISWRHLASSDVDAAFAQLQERGAEVVQEPIDQDYGVRDCAFRDPAGNMIRLQQKA